MNLTLSAIADLVQGALHGDGQLAVTGAATLVTAKPGEITLADNVKLARHLAASAASAVIVPHDYQPEGDRPFISVDNVHAAFATVVQQFRPQRVKRAVGVSPSASISASAQLSAGVEIHPLAFIGDEAVIGEGAIIHSGVRILEGCKIGAKTVIFPNAVLYENTIVGERCLIHSGAVLGAYGFGYHSSNGKHVMGSQLGWVEIGNDVDIGACSSVDRGTYGPTTIGDGTKLDNQVQVGHNCRVGKHNVICSQTGLAGSSSTGDFVIIAGQAGLRDHVHVGDRAVVGAKSGVMYDVEPGSRIVGLPATDERHQLLCVGAVHRLPAMRKEVTQMQKQLDALRAQLASVMPQHADAA